MFLANLFVPRATDMYMQKRRYTQMEGEQNNIVHNIEDDVAQNESGVSDESSDDDESHSDMSFQESSMDDSDISD